MDAGFDNYTHLVDIFQILVEKSRDLSSIDGTTLLDESLVATEVKLREILCGARPLSSEDILSLQAAVAKLLESPLHDEAHSSIECYSNGTFPDSMLLHGSLGYFPPNQRINELRFQVRGPRYLADQIKIPSATPLFHLRGMQLVQDNAPRRHVAAETWCALPTGDPMHRWLLVNFIVPGATIVHVFCIFSASAEAYAALTAADDSSSSSGWQRCLRRFWTADAAYCNERFKLFPRVQDASWAVNMAVGKNPALIGKKLRLDYFRGDNYMEIDVDISSSSTAKNILSMVRGVSRHMIMDIGIAIEATDAAELPERMLCQARMDHMDLNSALTLPTPTHF